jgi:hypothetical protein
MTSARENLVVPLGTAEADRLIAAVGRTTSSRGHWYRVVQAIVDEAKRTATLLVEDGHRSDEDEGRAPMDGS